MKASMQGLHVRRYDWGTTKMRRVFGYYSGGWGDLASIYECRIREEKISITVQIFECSSQFLLWERRMCLRGAALYIYVQKYTCVKRMEDPFRLPPLSHDSPKQPAALGRGTRRACAD